MKVDQATYTETKLREYGLERDPAPKLPMRPNARLSKSMGPETEEQEHEMKKVPYRSSYDRFMQLLQNDKAGPSGCKFDKLTIQ